MHTLVNDIHYAGRRMRAAPAFSLVAIVTLGLAIAATTAIYSVVDALMFRPLPTGTLTSSWTCTSPAPTAPRVRT